MRWTHIAVVCFGLAALSAHAQVHRCKDHTGKLIFSDRPCDTGQTGEQLQRKRSRQEILQEREQAFDAQLRKQDRRLADQEREWAAQRPRSTQPPAPVVRHSGNDWQARNDLRNAEVSARSITNNGGKWDQAAEAERAKARQERARREQQEAERIAREHPPTSFTNCNSGFCYDNQGGVYHRNGPDFMTGPNGRPCHRAGNMWHCG